MSEIAHNHPPRCCCEIPDGHAVADFRDNTPGPNDVCPLCPEHGELAQLGNAQPGECPLCHSEIGRQHTEYCRFTGTVSAMTASIVKAADHPNDWTATMVSQPPTQTSTPTTHARHELDRALLDATLTGNGYLLNGRRIPPEDIQIVRRDTYRTPGYDGPEGTEWPTPNNRWHGGTLTNPQPLHPTSACELDLCGREPTTHEGIHTRSLTVDPNPHPTTECHPYLCGHTPADAHPNHDDAPTPQLCASCLKDVTTPPAPACRWPDNHTP